MNLIKSSVVYFPQGDGLDGIYEQIERCGRTCYKSEDKMTKGSAQKFVDRMISSNHTAMLESGTVYLKMPAQGLWNEIQDHTYLDYIRNSYSKVHTKMIFEKEEDIIGLSYSFVTSNFRVLQENNWLDDLQYICEPTEQHERRYTFKFTCSRAIANELVRHRVFSFAQESQRYCGYDKSKFGRELTFIMPQWYKEAKYDSSKLNEFDKYLKQTEDLYMFYRDCEMQAQEARDILPNCTKTELCMTGFSSDWRNLLDLRLFQRTGVVHPDMLDLMQKTKNVMQQAGIWDDIMNSYSKFN